MQRSRASAPVVLHPCPAWPGFQSPGQGCRPPYGLPELGQSLQNEFGPVDAARRGPAEPEPSRTKRPGCCMLKGSRVKTVGLLHMRDGASNANRRRVGNDGPASIQVRSPRRVGSWFRGELLSFGNGCCKALHTTVPFRGPVPWSRLVLVAGRQDPWGRDAVQAVAVESDDARRARFEAHCKLRDCAEAKAVQI